MNKRVNTRANNEHEGEQNMRVNMTVRVDQWKKVIINTESRW